MEKIHILSSSSAGNCTLIQTSHSIVMFDIGISYKKLNSHLQSLHIAPEQITALLISHEHGDHINGLNVFLKRHPSVKVYMTRGTHTKILEKQRKSTKKFLPEHISINYITRADNIDLGNIQIRTFPTVHDAEEPVAFFTTLPSGKTITLLMDTGYPTQLAKKYAADSDVLLIEANYDENIIRHNSTRHWAHRERVMSRYGHLSNKQTLEFIQQILKRAPTRLKYVVLMHISEDHNDRDFMRRTFEEVLSPLRLKVLLSERDSPISFEIP